MDTGKGSCLLPDARKTIRLPLGVFPSCDTELHEELCVEPQRGVTLCQGKVPGWVHPQGLPRGSLLSDWGNRSPSAAPRGSRNPAAVMGLGMGLQSWGCTAQAPKTCPQGILTPRAAWCLHRAPSTALSGQGEAWDPTLCTEMQPSAHRAAWLRFILPNSTKTSQKIVPAPDCPALPFAKSALKLFHCQSTPRVCHHQG